MARILVYQSAASGNVFPAVDIAQSSTRKDELLLSPGELAATKALRRALSGRDTDVLLEGLRKTHTNIEFLSQLAR